MDPFGKHHSVIVGIAGGSGSGKTTIARKILSGFSHESVLLIQQDSYYMDLSRINPSAREQVNFDHPEAFDNDLLFQHLNDLKSGRDVDLPEYDFATHTRIGSSRKANPCKMIILEGIMILHDQRLRGMMDLKVFVDADADIRLTRRLERDTIDRGRTVESVIQQYTTTVQPMFLEFVEPTKRFADIIIPEAGLCSDHVEKLIATLTERYDSVGLRAE